MKKILFFVLFLIVYYAWYTFGQKKQLVNKIMPINKHSKFPTIIYRTYNFENVCFEMHKQCHEKWLKLNPSYSMVWYSNEDCDRFMKKYFFGEINDAYCALKPGAYKADLWRLCILYKFGGVYADAFMTPYISIDKMIEGCNADFISVLDCALSGHGIHNGFIISVKKHPFLKRCIDMIVRNVRSRYYGSCPLSITGPIVLSAAIKSLTGLKTSHKEGLNEHGSLSYYLFRLNYGLQTVHKEGLCIGKKYFNFLFYF